jgi:hypothetical protein
LAQHVFVFKPLKPKFVYIIFKNSVHVSNRTPQFTITKIKWLMLVKEIIDVYIENNTRPISTKCTVTDR